MKCPNCQFEIQQGSSSCPFCNYSIPKDDAVGGAPDTEPGAVPTPGEDEPQLQDLSGGEADSLADPLAGPVPTPEPTPEPEEPAPPPDDDDFVAPVAQKRSPLAILLPLVVACAAGYGAYTLYKPTPTEHSFAVQKKDTPPAAPAQPQQPQTTEARTPDAPADTRPPSSGTKQSPTASKNPVLNDPRMARLMNAQKKRIREEEKAAEEAAAAELAAQEEAPAPKPAAPEVKPGDRWVFEGLVYDMISLRPVPRANMIFLAGDDQSDFFTTTNAKGRYRISLPAMLRGGYSLMIDHKDYLADYFDESSPSYRKMARSRRLQLRAAKPRHSPWRGSVGKNVRRDLVVFPDITDR